MKKILGLIMMLIGLMFLISIVLNSGLAHFFADQQQQKDVVTVDGIKKINIDSVNANVRIFSEDREDVKAILHGPHSERFALNIEAARDELTIRTDEAWFQFLMFESELTLDVYLPESYSYDLEVILKAGNLQVQGGSNAHPLALNEINAQLSAGNANYRYLSANHLGHNSSAGNLVLQDTKAGTARLNASAGNIKLTRFTGALTATLLTGNLEAELDDLQGKLEADVKAGNIMIRLPKQTEFAVLAQVTAGKIHSDFTLDQWRENSQNTLQGSIGSEPNSLHLIVGAGNIQIRSK